MMATKWSDYIRAMEDMQCGDFERDIARAIQYIKEARSDKARVFFIGNGGSAATAMHFANDFQQTARLPAQALTDAAVLTCVTNDWGYGAVYTDQLAFHAHAGDILFALSGSGESPNILAAASVSKMRKLAVITLTGYKPTNSLRNIGDINFYVPHLHYGLVEQVHFTILHHIVDCVADAG